MFVSDTFFWRVLTSAPIFNPGMWTASPHFPPKKAEKASERPEALKPHSPSGWVCLSLRCCLLAGPGITGNQAAHNCSKKL